ncbi:reverse transcriptase domain-containing protein [Tanacetum coccineum]
MLLSMWKKLGLPELVSTQITLELANRDICTPKGIARDVFVPVRKSTFSANFVIVNYESDPRVPLILGRPFLRTARALIDVHGEEMILRDDLFATNHPSGNPTSSLTSHTDLTAPEVNDDIFDPEGDIIENFLNLDKTKALPPYHDNPLSGNPTPISEPETKSSSSSPTLTSIEESDLIWEEFEAYLASDSFPSGNSNPSTPLPLFHNSLSVRNGFILEDSVDKNSLDDNLDDTIYEMFTDEHALDYSSPPLWDDYDDELFDLETINDDTYDDPFNFEEEKIKESKLLIDELDLLELSDFLPFPECDSLFYEDFSEVDALPSTDNEDKIFNRGILIHENHFEVTNLATMEKNVKKTINDSLILEDFNPPLYELLFHKEESFQPRDSHF